MVDDFHFDIGHEGKQITFLKYSGEKGEVCWFHYAGTSPEIEEVKKIIHNFEENKDYYLDEDKNFRVFNEGKENITKRYEILNQKLRKLLWETNKKFGGILSLLESLGQGVKMEEIDENLYPRPPHIVIYPPLTPMTPSLRGKSRSECEKEMKRYKESVANYNEEVKEQKKEIDEYVEKILKTRGVKEVSKN